jgi:hypothetical protein
MLSLPLLSTPARAGNEEFVDALQSMMSELRPESRRAASTIREIYGPLVTREAFENRGALAAALAGDEVAPLPIDPLAYNIDPRLLGAHPIGEKDLAYQHMYAAARPAALGLLYAIASRVESSPVEVTSLVRHMQYQRTLLSSNGNARTDVPTHAMGMAFDIALVNTPLQTAYEIRDVLRRLRDDGALYFIGESQQLVFHVVPNPSRFGYYEALYLARTCAPVPPMPPAPTLDELMPRPVPAPRMVELSWWQRLLT